jgi:hypothetical protein
VILAQLKLLYAFMFEVLLWNESKRCSSLKTTLQGEISHLEMHNQPIVLLGGLNKAKSTCPGEFSLSQVTTISECCLCETLQFESGGGGELELWSRCEN